MESSIWTRIKAFIQQSLTSKFKAFFPGCVIGLFGAKSLLFAGLPPEVVTFGAYCLKFMGTVLMAFGSGLGTAYGALLIEKHKNKTNGPRTTEKKRGNGKAA